MSDIRQMLNTVRQRVNESKKPVDLPQSDLILEHDSIYLRSRILMEEAELKPGEEATPDGKSIVISKSNTQFGSVRQSQEETLRKTIGDVKFKKDAFKYYDSIEDIVVNGEINGLGVTFQFRYKDPSGDGCYIWADGLQLTDSNNRTIEKIRDAFLNWKQSIMEDGDLIEKLHQEANKED